MADGQRLGGRTFAALSVRNFRLYFFGQLISVSGTWMQMVAQGWLVLQITGSSVDLGFAVALQYVPTLLLGTYGGVLVDRFDKRRTLYCTQGGAGLLAIVLGLLVTTHHVSLVAVYVMATVLGLVNTVDTPARQAFVQEMVGRDLIANAVSLNSVLMNAGRLIGPGIAAGFIAAVGTATCFYANGLSYFAVILALVLMDASAFTPLRRVSREKGQLRLGFRYVMANPLLRNTVIAVAVVGTFAYNFTVTLPLFSRVTFHEKTATHYGLLMAAMGFGAIIGGLFIAWRSRPSLALLTSLAVGFGACMTAAALSPSIIWAEILFIPTGAFSVAFISTANATLQLNSSEEMRGRVMSFHVLAFLGTTPIGAPLMGWIVATWNPRVGLLTGSLLTLATGAWLIAAHRSEARNFLAPAS